MSVIDPAKLLESYRRDGYVHIKGVFSPAETADIRNRIASLAQRQGDVLSHPTLRPVLLDERVLSSVRALLGPRIVYFGDSVIRYESTEDTRGFHRDSQPDHEDPTLTEYPVVRCSIYLQDHAKRSGGLKVRRGSYRHVFLGRENLKRLLWGKPHGPLRFAAFRLGRAVNLDIELGDLVIWNLRTWHSGYAVRLKWFPRFCINPRLEKYIPKWMCIPDIRPRAALFVSFGVPSANLDSYIRDRATHPTNEEHWKVSRFDDPAVVAACAEKGLELRFDAIGGVKRL